MPKFNSVMCVCRSCGKEFLCNPSKIKRGRGLHCSRACRSSSIEASLAERFWSKVEKTDGCWLWRGGSFHSFGYGVFAVKHQNRQAHRVAYELTNGKIPKGLIVCHKCDNPPCVNPDHLFLGTFKDNNDDRDKKGRTFKNEAVEKLAATFNVTSDYIREIIASCD